MSACMPIYLSLNATYTHRSMHSIDKALGPVACLREKHCKRLIRFFYRTCDYSALNWFGKCVEYVRVVGAACSVLLADHFGTELPHRHALRLPIACCRIQGSTDSFVTTTAVLTFISRLITTSSFSHKLFIVHDIY